MLSSGLVAGLVGACTMAYLSKYLPDSVPPIEASPSIVPAISAILGYAIGTFGYAVIQWLRWEILRQLLTYTGWIYDQRSRKTKIWGFLLTLVLPRKWGLYTFQPYLPKMPLPSLEKTCAKMLQTARPLVSDEEYAKVGNAVQDLMNNEGPQLQAILRKRHEAEDNWVIDLWNNLAYMSQRSPLPINSNFCTLSVPERFTDIKQTAIAGCIIHHLLRYREKLEEETITAMMIQRMIPICCDRYRYVFSHTRIPGSDMDELTGYPTSKHIVVFRRGHMYKINMYSKDRNGHMNLLTPLEIQKMLEVILLEADAKDVVNGPGVFTTMERSSWAEIRLELKGSDLNAPSLEAVESAAFCVDLSDDEPENLSEEFHLYLTGDCRNRWFDKSCTLIVNKNASFGLNNEHSTTEATISGRALEYALYHLHYDHDGNATHESLNIHDEIADPELLKWNLNAFSDVMTEATNSYNTAADDIDTLVKIYHKGKGEIKKQRVSPDGFLQMVMQLAFYRLHQCTPKTYETAATRIFNKGRTETIRPISVHSVAFTKSFDDPSIPASEKIEHLKKAIDYQTMYKYDAMTGRAIDRHMLGLYASGKMIGKVPKVFTLKPFTDSDRLSTSQSPMFFDPVIGKLTPHTPTGGGFGALTNDGYGVAYFLLHDHRMHFLISSYKSCPATGSETFANAIDQAFDDMLLLLKNKGVVTEDMIKHGDTNGVNKNK